jgi:hypothetical protein
METGNKKKWRLMNQKNGREIKKQKKLRIFNRQKKIYQASTILFIIITIGYPFFAGFYLWPTITKHVDERYPRVSAEYLNHKIDAILGNDEINLVATNLTNYDIIIKGRSTVSVFELYIERHFTQGTIIYPFLDTHTGQCTMELKESEYVKLFISLYIFYGFIVSVALPLCFCCTRFKDQQESDKCFEMI